MESWMVSFGLAIISGIVMFTVLRANVQRLCAMSRDHANDIIKIKEQVGKLASIREVRQEFVSKEMFTQIRQHFDDEFKRLELGLNKILTKLEK